MNQIDNSYCGLPWKAGGRTRNGLDCAGLAQLWLTEQLGLIFEAPASGPEPDAESAFGEIPFKEGPLRRGDVVFFRNQSNGRVCHVAIYLGDDRYLHTVRGHASMIVSSRLIQRLGMTLVGAISAQVAERICLALGGNANAVHERAAEQAETRLCQTN